MWSLDFMCDQPADGRMLRTLNVVDYYNREALGIAVDLSLSAEYVCRELNRVIRWCNKLKAIRRDNDHDFISYVFSKPGAESP